MIWHTEYHNQKRLDEERAKRFDEYNQGRTSQVQSMRAKIAEVKAMGGETAPVLRTVGRPRKAGERWAVEYTYTNELRSACWEKTFDSREEANAFYQRMTGLVGKTEAETKESA